MVFVHQNAQKLQKKKLRPLFKSYENGKKIFSFWTKKKIGQNLNKISWLCFCGYVCLDIVSKNDWFFERTYTQLETEATAAEMKEIEI